MFMQTDKVDCAPLPGQRTYGVFFPWCSSFFSLLYPCGRGREVPGFGIDAQKNEGNRLNCGSELHFFWFAYVAALRQYEVWKWGWFQGRGFGVMLCKRMVLITLSGFGKQFLSGWVWFGKGCSDFAVSTEEMVEAVISESLLWLDFLCLIIWNRFSVSRGAHFCWNLVLYQVWGSALTEPKLERVRTATGEGVQDLHC